MVKSEQETNTRMENEDGGKVPSNSEENPPTSITETKQDEKEEEDEQQPGEKSEEAVKRETGNEDVGHNSMEDLPDVKKGIRIQKSESNSIITGESPEEEMKVNLDSITIPERIDLKNSNGKIRRPRNAFILFRSHQHKSFINGFLESGKPIPHNSQISKMIGFQWRSLSRDEKAVWEKAALKEREDHLIKYPDYKYQPVRRKAKRELRDKEKVLKKQQKRVMEALEKHKKMMDDVVSNPLQGLTMHAKNVFPTGPTMQQHEEQAGLEKNDEGKDLSPENEQDYLKQTQEHQMGPNPHLNGYYSQDVNNIGATNGQQVEQMKLQQQKQYEQYQQLQQYEQMRLMQQQQYQFMQQQRQHPQLKASGVSNSVDNMQELYDQQQYEMYNQAALAASMGGYGSSLAMNTTNSARAGSSNGTATAGIPLGPQSESAESQNSAALMQQQYYLYQQQQQQAAAAASGNPGLYGGGELSYDYYYQKPPQQQESQQPPSQPQSQQQQQQQQQHQQQQQQQQYAQYYQQSLPQGYYYAQGPDGQPQIYQQQPPMNDEMYQQQYYQQSMGNSNK